MKIRPNVLVLHFYIILFLTLTGVVFGAAAALIPTALILIVAAVVTALSGDSA